MPSRERAITAHDVRRFVDERCFAPSSREGHVGVEVEWLPVDLGDPDRSLPPGPLPGLASVADLGAMPAGSLLTLEPGGQVELSSPPLRGIGPACAALAADAAALTHDLAEHGVGLVGIGCDPRPEPDRRIHGPRYDAMEAYFDTEWAAGRTMMRATAAVQVNVDLGPDAATAQARWQRAHDLGPTLAGAFANSPLGTGAWPSGWRSRRLAVWSDLDAGRTVAAANGGPDCCTEWADYALGARVMLIRRDERDFVPLSRPLTFAEWVDDGHELGYPTLADLEYHLTTLFPPVRPRGWLELRMIDALPDPWWRVAVAVAVTLVADDDAAATCAGAIEPTRDMWRDAARHGLDHPDLARSARVCFEATLDALSRLGSDATTIAAVAAFHERYSARGRCPADDRLAEWAEHGTLLPDADRFLELSWA
ncbi:MAG TPA: ergothioneine biosynthesis glutamate--cysteine ligase EgtA [Acidimicrobiia bacterium]